MFSSRLCECVSSSFVKRQIAILLHNLNAVSIYNKQQVERYANVVFRNLRNLEGFFLISKPNIVFLFSESQLSISETAAKILIVSFLTMLLVLH
jgi:hypothetical protein